MTKLTLSFDNGPWAGHTDAVLDLLRERGLKASFFVVGNRLADPTAAGVAARAHAEGHWIGNHTMSHLKPLGMTEATTSIDEIDRAEALIGGLAHPARFFRPPGKGRLGSHLLNPLAADHLAAEGYTVVTWNNVPRDYDDHDGAWVGRALEALHAQPWSLLVLHDHHLARMPGTLERFLDLVSDVEIVQEFPDDCVLMNRGQARPALSAAITESLNS